MTENVQSNSASPVDLLGRQFRFRHTTVLAGRRDNHQCKGRRPIRGRVAVLGKIRASPVRSEKPISLWVEDNATINC
jgi:hypothetical protein